MKSIKTITAVTNLVEFCAGCGVKLLAGRNTGSAGRCAQCSAESPARSPMRRLNRTTRGPRPPETLDKPIKRKAKQ